MKNYINRNINNFVLGVKNSRKQKLVTVTVTVTAVTDSVTEQKSN